MSSALRIALISLCLLAVGFVLFSREQTDLPVGQQCLVQFRRNTLGSPDAIVSPTINAFNNGSTRVLGTLVKVTDKWVVLKVDDPGDPAYRTKVWIPRDVVLLIEALPEKRPQL